MENKTFFGEELKKRRLETGFGLRRFAEIIPMTPSRLSRIEHGREPLPKEEDGELFQGKSFIERICQRLQ